MGNGKVKMGVKAAVCAALLWLCLAAPAAYAGALTDIDIAFERKDYATLFRLMRPSAEQGNASAQNIFSASCITRAKEYRRILRTGANLVPQGCRTGARGGAK